MSDKKHIPYLDYLRLFACLAVVWLHVSVQKWAGVEAGSITWQIYNGYSSLVRWAVPVFVMISGALFLGREIPVTVLLRRNILRLVILFFIWSVFYAVIYPLSDILINGAETFSVKRLLYNILKGHYHMWFFPMFVGLYLCTPVFSRLVRDEKMAKYLLLLALIFSFIIPFAVDLLEDFGSGIFSLFEKAIAYQESAMQVQTVSAYGGYFILGYVLSRRPPEKKQRVVIYVLGLLGVLLTVLLSALYAGKYSIASTRYFQEHTLNVAVQAVAIFVFFQSRSLRNNRFNGCIYRLSQCSLGVILLHPFVMSVLDILGIHTSFTHPILAVPIVWLVVCVICFAVIYVLRRIPFLDRYMT